jgi:hypothetical protein
LHSAYCSMYRKERSGEKKNKIYKPDYNVRDLHSKQNIFVLTPNSYMFQVEQPIIGLIHSVIIGKSSSHRKDNILLCLLWGSTSRKCQNNKL